MAALTICPWTRVRGSERRELEVVRPLEAPKRQDREDREESPLLQANAADALLLAASPIGEDRAGRHVVAVVLDDGTVLEGGRAASARRSWANGKVAGTDWTLWWERRAQISGS